MDEYPATESGLRAAKREARRSLRAYKRARGEDKLKKKFEFLAASNAVMGMHQMLHGRDRRDRRRRAAHHRAR